jgi:hypothetical protein
MTKRKPSRRLFLAAGSATAVFGALSVAAAQEQAPVFAAIERLKTAWAVFSGASDLTEDEKEAFALAEAEWSDAEEALLSTTPTTLAGAHAAIAYLVKYDEGCTGETSGSFLPVLLASPIFARSAS